MNKNHLKKMAQRKAMSNIPKQEAVRERRINQEVEKFKKDTEMIAVQSIMATVLITLHDHEGWGKKRLNRLVSLATKNLECVKEKLVTLDDFEKWCEDYGIEGL